MLTLLAINPAFDNAVTLQGAVADPVRHRWFEGMRILDLIPEPAALVTRDFYRRRNLLVQNDDAANKSIKETSEGVSGRVRATVDQINWEYAVIERFDRQTLRRPAWFRSTSAKWCCNVTRPRTSHSSPVMSSPS